MMRVGMFVTATFHGQKPEAYAAVPASAILHLHDRDWVYVPDEGDKFRRTEVVSGEMLPDEMQEIVSGIQPGPAGRRRCPGSGEHGGAIARCDSERADDSRSGRFRAE